MELDDSGAPAGGLGERIAGLGVQEEGFVTRRRIADVAGKLFGAISGPVEAAKIGRFTIVRELGAGGMGVVYLCYDEQLDRRVAVKLLRGGMSSEEAQARFEREAQAMARLSHHNVVTVHEVGTFDGQPFVAMEFVEGQDLRAWLSQGERPWSEVLELFGRAGAGLAAAHAAGIVHRDFKPDNVLVGDDGRVCVADFGLAHALDEAPLAHDIEARAASAEFGLSSSSNKLYESLTRTGAVMGTPAYMAPEQYRGLATDARTDQFSFCVALWEGLYGRRPFGGHNLLALSAAIALGELEPVPPEREAPSWVHAAVVRGLRPQPDARFPSMEALLEALASDPHARRRRVLRRVSLGLLVCGALGASTWQAVTQLQHNTRQRYWNTVTESLLEMERGRGLAQAQDDATRASDAAHMSVMQGYKGPIGAEEREDPTVAAALLREVHGEARNSGAWISAANEVLGAGVSFAVLEGHGEAVGPVVFGRDGTWLYSAADDGEVRRWALAGGEGEVIIDHGREVNVLVLSPDGRWLASGGEDGSARLWDTGTGPGRELVVARHGAGVQALVFDARGRKLASGAADGDVRIHDMSGGRSVEIPVLEGTVWALSFDVSGERLLTASSDGLVRVWSASDGRLLSTLAGHEDDVFHLRALPDGRVLSAADDGSVRLWMLPSSAIAQSQAQGEVLVEHDSAISALDLWGGMVASAGVSGTMRVTSLDPPHVSIELPSHAGAVYSLRFGPAGKELFSASLDGTAQRSAVEGRGSPERFLGHRQSLYGLALSADARWMATGSYDATLRLWELARPRLSRALRGHEATVMAIAVDADGAGFVTTSHDKRMQLWTAAGVARDSIEVGSMIRCAAFSPDGEQVAVGTNVGVTLLASEGGEALASFAHARAVADLDFDRAGRRLATASMDAVARIWDLGTGTGTDTGTDTEPLELRGHEGRLVAVEFDEPGKRLFSASTDGSVRIWDAHSGAALAQLGGHEGKILSFARTRDSRVLAGGADDGRIQLWSGDDYGELTALEGHDQTAWALRFDASETRLLSASFDGSARVWAVADGSLVASLGGHGGEVWDARFLPDGRVVTAGADTRVRVWDPDSAGPAIVLSGHEAQVSSLALLPGGRLVSGAIDGSVRYWRLDLLRADPGALLEGLEAITRYCLPVSLRVAQLGVDPALALTQLGACRARYSGSAPR